MESHHQQLNEFMIHIDKVAKLAPVFFLMHIPNALNKLQDILQEN